MKKVLFFALVLLIGIAFVSTGFAQDKAKPAPAAEKKAPSSEKKATEEKPAAEKAEPAKEE
ncbi:MAG TPA: taurine ABC transporter substrate-binding protein, partial [Syntrophorhabdaceae bacterium]|nr:taurine ABC transporter substrate-binding protein [Syntrophorhabdaceae bacterium]